MINQAKKYLGISIDGKNRLLVDYYNHYVLPLVERKYKIKYTDDWCAMFTSVIAHQKGVLNFPFEVSCWYQREWAKKRGLWRDRNYTPKPNDLIYYDWGKGNRINHVGFVVTVENGKIRTIEGNKDRTVSNRVISQNNRMIIGYIETGYNVDIDDLVKRTLKGEFGNGEERKRKLGSNYDYVMSVINRK